MKGHAGQREYGLAVQLGIIQTVEQVDAARA